MKANPDFVSDEDEEAELDQSLESLEGRETSSAQGTDQVVEDEPALAEARYLEVVEVARAMLAGERVELDQLAELSDDERAALEFLEQVVRGRNVADGFMYAEERLEGLNQVLAQLQPLLSVGGVHQVLNDSLAEVVDGFAELRDRLTLLEDAQEEVFHEPEKKKPGEDDDDDDGGDDDAEADADADVEKAPARSTVWDPDDRGDGPA